MEGILKSVSRETISDLRLFEALVFKWTKKINLVSAGDSAAIWERHILDSYQVYDLAPKEGDWLDIGSGGGFPGIVCAILSKAALEKRRVTLVDSDQRKCAFLRTAARELNLNVTVYSERVEEMKSQKAAILSARALDDLDGLLEHASKHLAVGGTCLFPKGARWQDEDEKARRRWSYTVDAVPSMTNPVATILKITEISRV